MRNIFFDVVSYSKQALINESVTAPCGNTDLERPASWGKELKTGSLPGVFSQVGDELNAVVADIKGALLLFICRHN